MSAAMDVTVLFADIAGSARLYERFGDEAAKALVTEVIGRIASAVSDEGGDVVKTIGDEILATFPEPGFAVRAARGLNRSLADSPPKMNGRGHSVTVATGLHAGPVIREGADIFGDTVNLASRMVSMAKAGQILATEEVATALPSDLSDFARLVDVTRVKGRAEDVRIHEIVWEEAELTMVVDATNMLEGLGMKMEVRWGDDLVVVDGGRASVTLGRDEANDLVCPGLKTSRRHARIVYRRGKYVLVDESTNGTWLAERGKSPVLLKRDEAPLYEKGRIGLGAAVDEDPDNTVRYELTF